MAKKKKRANSSLIKFIRSSWVDIIGEFAANILSIFLHIQIR